MKRGVAVVLTLLLTCLLGTSVVSASNPEWGKVTFSMKIPDGVVVESPLYVMYTGPQTDLFAELNADNGFTQTIDAPLGDYELYQVVLSGDTVYQFMGPMNFTVSDDQPTVYIYIADGENGIINVDATGEEPPANLASYGEVIAREMEAAQLAEQQELERQQQEALAGTPEGAIVDTPTEDQPEQETADQGRNTKIKAATGTEDTATNNLVPLLIAGAAIVGVGILITVAIMIRKVNLSKQGNDNDNNGKSITN